MIQSFQNFIELDLTNTNISDVDQLFVYIGPSKNIRKLLLSSNEISTLPNFQPTNQFDLISPSDWFSNLDYLSMSENKFSDWQFSIQLLRLSNLTRLIISNCPLQKTTSL